MHHSWAGQAVPYVRAEVMEADDSSVVFAGDEFDDAHDDVEMM
tara:strand:- start:86 stop:214 length:129 start_codon:yes stop_codon:yes gene_type:complete